MNFRALNRPFRDIVVNGIAASLIFNSWQRCSVYRLYGLKIGYKCAVRAGCSFQSKKVEIGNETRINYRCRFFNDSIVKIGDNCDVAIDVKFIGNTHYIADGDRRAGDSKCFPVTVGNGCIIGAGSVVTKDCEPNSVYVGNPARKIRVLD